MGNERKNSRINKKDTISITTKKYLSIQQEPVAIKRKLSIELSNHSYLPRTDDLQSDWVAWAAVPAFKLYMRRLRRKRIDSFCSIGTGSGVDVLAAMEIMGAQRVGLTDVHEDVVATAVSNVVRNKKPGSRTIVQAGNGDLLAPLKQYSAKYELIYENLPNVPMPDAEDLADGRKSSLYLAKRKEKIPELIRSRMLDLHYLALVQAEGFLLPKGKVLSVMGGRVPLDVFLELGRLAGYTSSILLYTWKIQADAGEIIRDYAQKQKKGFGPFHFYKSSVLEKKFASVNQARSGATAAKIEKSLASHRLDAVEAYEEFKKGVSIGHTVVVLASKRN
jgi:hypothetical protein